MKMRAEAQQKIEDAILRAVAVAEEREACARLCDAAEWENRHGTMIVPPEAIAAQIRARGAKP